MIVLSKWLKRSAGNPGLNFRSTVSAEDHGLPTGNMPCKFSGRMQPSNSPFSFAKSCGSGVLCARTGLISVQIISGTASFNLHNSLDVSISRSASACMAGTPLHRTRHTASHSLSTSSTRSTRRSRPDSNSWAATGGSKAQNSSGPKTSALLEYNENSTVLTKQKVLTTSQP